MLLCRLALPSRNAEQLQGCEKEPHIDKKHPQRNIKTHITATQRHRNDHKGATPPRQQPQRLDQTAAKSYKQITETITEGKLPEDN